ncbi:hypothetical protein [Bombilactobacillus bombi]|uniref:hypothetical protein n=1 Tax=Bombilactobacillus bombi TaxID=1303590 RepID=UPI0015E5D995|nr:hypothetical protein [Bombilactobacillus bombi]MBA1435155.1 hypothetical protein [Bombilactobacillus bombi]
MKKKTMKQMLKKSKLNREKIYAQATFSDGRVLRIPVFADDQPAIENLKQQLISKNGTLTDTNNNIYDLHNLVHYEFIK